jgi:putative salt-induced outer membrane protein YdiY
MLGGADAVADIVTLADGSRLVGSIEQLADGKLKLTTDFAGTLEIDAAKVVAIETDGAVNVGLATGDCLVGPMRPAPAGDGATVETAMGDVPVGMDNVKAIWPKDGKSPEVLAMEAAAEAKAPKWSASLEAGANLTEGNTETLEARGRAELRRTTDVDLLKFYLSGDYGEQNDVRSIAEVKGGAYYEHVLGEQKRWFAYGSTDAEYDEFENLDLRLLISVGGGYYWIREEDHELKTRAGIGYKHESFKNGVVEDDAMLDVGLDYRLDITPWLQLLHATTYYPTLSSLDDYRLVSDTGFLIPLGNSEVWKLKLGALYEYNAIPQPGFERLDQTYYGNIVVELK